MVLLERPIPVDYYFLLVMSYLNIKNHVLELLPVDFIKMLLSFEFNFGLIIDFNLGKIIEFNFG